VNDYVGWGAGPRASQYLILAGKARALLKAGITSAPKTSGRLRCQCFGIAS